MNIVAIPTEGLRVTITQSNLKYGEELLGHTITAEDLPAAAAYQVNGSNSVKLVDAEGVTLYGYIAEDQVCGDDHDPLWDED